MAKIEPTFREYLASNPTQRVDIIVRTADNPQNRVLQVAEHGLSIRHLYSLINALAATGLGSSILNLAGEPWVEKIEPDEEVHVMN